MILNRFSCGLKCCESVAQNIDYNTDKGMNNSPISLSEDLHIAYREHEAVHVMTVCRFMQVSISVSCRKKDK